LVDAVTGYLYGFEIYIGKNAEEDGSAKAIVQRLLCAADMTSHGRGCIVFMDNWYTGQELFKAIYEEFGLMCVGTVVGTKKLSRTGADFPFHKLSPQALQHWGRGEYRLAYRNVHRRDWTDGPVQFTMQAVTWRDKKQVFILTNHMVDVSNVGNVVRRYSPRRRAKQDIPSPKIVKEYTKYYGGVDRKDRSDSDWTVTLKSHRWYMREVRN